MAENSEDKVKVTIERRFDLGKSESVNLWMAETRTVEDRSKKARSLARRSMAKQINEDLEYVADYLNNKTNKDK